MCCCPEPNINGTPGYSWDGKGVSTRPVDPPALADGDVLLFDEPGRCGGLDSHCHHYRVVKRPHGGLALLVHHGLGDESHRLSLPHGFSFDGIDSNTRYWILNAIHRAAKNARSEQRDKTAMEYRAAFIDGRLKKRKLPARGVKVWIEPKTEDSDA